jgi:hypothetical protein
MIDIICPKDGTLHNADESNFGKTLRCRTCGATLKIGPQDQHPPIGIAQGPVKEAAEARVTNKPLAGPKTEDARPQRMIRRESLLMGAGLGVIVVMLLIAIWPNHPPSILRQIKSNDQNPAVRETRPEPSSGVPAPGLVMRRPNVKPVQAKPDLEGNPPGALPPCAQGRNPLRLKTGERIKPDGGTSGASNMQVMNAGGLDAAVKMMDSVTGKTSRFVYVQAGHSFTIEGIEAGAYLLQFQYGRDWIPECQDFMRDADYLEFANPFVFLDDRIRFYEVTISPVVGGKTLTRRIDRRRFLAGDQNTGVSP